jgi:hypothetical protein
LRKGFFKFMSKILITGNGFDLFHGLPTKYGHFMAIMMTIEDCNFEDKITFEELFGKIFRKKFSYEYDLILENYHTKNMFFEDKKIEEIRLFLKDNSWYQHFKSVLNLTTWIDFEIEIERILNELSILFNKQIEKNVIRYSPTEIYIRENFLIFGITSMINTYAFRINDKYIDSRTKIIDERKVLEHLSQSLKHFTLIFNNYLFNIVFPFYSSNKIDNVKYFEKIDQFLTFNYTDSIQKFYGIEESKLRFIHGRVNENNNEHNIILGIESIPEKLNKFKVYDFEKSFQRVISNVNSVFIEEPQAGKYLTKVHFFYVIGHSLDKSDSNYINDVFRYLTLDESKSSKIIIFYYDQDDYTLKLRNLYSYVGKITIERLNKDERLLFKTLNDKNLIEYINDIEINEDIYI